MDGTQLLQEELEQLATALTSTPKTVVMSSLRLQEPPGPRLPVIRVHSLKVPQLLDLTARTP